MLNKALYLILFLGLPLLAVAQEARTIDGTGNNQTNTTWNSVGEPMTRMTPVAYSDGISSPAGTTRPNPRIISNALFAQDTLFHDPLHLSDFVWVFGQFIDHDITAVSNDPTEPVGIPVNFPDEHFNPGGAFPDVEIHMSRSAAHPGTGTGVDNPRQHTNEITGWIDASNVYGSDTDRANYLRTFSGGKLKTSAGNLLPYNTSNHEQGAPVDPTAPFMDNENPFNSVLFVAGDSRANEQPLLAAFHTLFVREHNRLCDIYALENPGWNDEQLYQKARRVVGGLLQATVYEQWLPVMGVHLPAFTGYDATVDPNIMNEFSAAAFRLGHTLLNSNLRRIDIDGEDISPLLTLKDAFFNPFDLATTGMDPFFRGMAAQVEQDCDGKVVSDVRNFLFGPPGAGGLDLAAININRGRERGLADFNTIRTEIGLTPFTSFEAINPDPAVYTVLENLYGTVDEIDPWVGMLVESHMPAALFGETIMHIMIEQFQALRDGDRFYYEADPYLTQAEKDSIKNTLLRDIIMRNTGVEIMQENVFEAMPFDSICMASLPVVDIEGGISTDNGVTVSEVIVDVADENGNLQFSELTNEIGDYLIEEVATCEYYTITPTKDGNDVNGVSTFDLIKILRHVVETELLDSPYKIIAADANADGDVTTLDAVELRKLILFIETDLATNTSWRFVDGEYVFDNPLEPLDEDFREHKEVTMLSESALLDFVAVKVGDVNGTVDGNGFGAGGGDGRTDEVLTFELEDRMVFAGERLVVPFYASKINEVSGFQFTLNYDREAMVPLAAERVSLPAIGAQNFGVLEAEGAITASWNADASELEGDEILFELSFEVKRGGLLSELISMNSRFTKSEAYTQGLTELMDVELRFNDVAGELVPQAGFELYQNKPNPFEESTVIGFNLSDDSAVGFKIYDLTGRLLKSTESFYVKGYHELTVSHDELADAGSIFYYEIETDFGTAIKKMVLIR